MSRIFHNNHHGGKVIGKSSAAATMVSPVVGGRAWGDNLPTNLSWLVVNKLAGSACPQSELELRSLPGINITHVVTLSPEAKPPNCITKIPNLKWTIIPIENFQGATIEDFNTFFQLLASDNDVASGEKNGATLVHCKSGRGRTGMFLAAYLMRFHGMSAAESIADVRAKRPHSIETKAQEDRLGLLEDFLKLSQNP